ncbi:hypothetical protein [Fibrobacter sp.]|uniref:hypothetical protein n=1 Tax=Fibrobacter sp. TaxID=35828 RepID=UPI0025C0B8F1|nr:hypothetical protein [Fibrobacter sp.]MBR3073973.1 hypothetical protein [Fibrobacter sp.]
MDIKKCKVEKNCEWSAAVVKGLAVTLGMSALVSLEGCASNVAKTNNDLTESVQPSSSSELPSSSMFESISSSSSNESEKNKEMTPEEILDFEDPFSNMSEEEMMEKLKEYLETHKDYPDGGVIEMYNGEN